jgi:enamine deaminase RidA (YjgF/YER057c/UK114 family)
VNPSDGFLAVLARWPRAVEAGPFLFFGGQFGLGPGGGLCARFADATGHGPQVERDAPWAERIEGPIHAQAVAIYERLKEVLARQGGGLGHLLRLHLYQRDKRFFPVFDRVRRHYEPSSPAPSTAVGMGRFEPAGGAWLDIDGIALRPGMEGEIGPRRALGGSPRHAAAAHFSHVAGAGPYLFVAGQIPIDTSRAGAPLIRGYEDIPPEGRFLQAGRSHEDARNGPIAAQSWFTYDLIRQHLEGAGSSLAQIINLTVYLQDMRDFPTFHRVHARFFPETPPPLTVIQAGEVGHKGTLVEIEPTALLPGKGVERRLIPGGGHPALGARMSLGAEAGGVLFLSGMAGVDEGGEPVATPSALPPGARRFLEHSPGPARPAPLQAAAILSRIEEALAGQGAGLARLAQLSVFLEDIGDFWQVEPLLAGAFPGRRPVICAAEAPRSHPLEGARVSMTAIAWLGEGEPREAR